MGKFQCRTYNQIRFFSSNFQSLCHFQILLAENPLKLLCSLGEQLTNTGASIFWKVLFIIFSWVKSDSPRPMGDELCSESPPFAGINRSQLWVLSHLPYTIQRRCTSFQRSSWTKSFLQFCRRETDIDRHKENMLLFVALSARAVWPSFWGRPILESMKTFTNIKEKDLFTRFTVSTAQSKQEDR